MQHLGHRHFYVEQGHEDLLDHGYLQGIQGVPTRRGGREGTFEREDHLLEGRVVHESGEAIAGQQEVDVLGLHIVDAEGHQAGGELGGRDVLPVLRVEQT